MSWTPEPLGRIVAGIEAGEITGPAPKLLRRTDGAALLYPGILHSLAGEPEAGKGWIALAACTEVLTGGGKALYIDFEDSAENVTHRLLALGTPGDVITGRLAYVAPDEAPEPGIVDALAADGPWEIVVLDGMSEAYSLLGLDASSNQDVPAFLRALARPFARTGAAVVLIDHVTKDRNTRGRYALGGGHKLAGVTVAYTVDVITPPDRQNTGRARLIVQKDRHGHVRASADHGTAADVTITPEDGGSRVTVALDAPEHSIDAEGVWHPTRLMEKASKLIEGDEGLTRNEVLEGVGGKKEYAVKALALLVSEGFVERRKDGQKHRHYSHRPYREGDPPAPQPGPGSQPGPNRVPDPVPATGSPGPPPIGDPDPAGPGAPGRPTGSRDPVSPNGSEPSLDEPLPFEDWPPPDPDDEADAYRRIERAQAAAPRKDTPA